MIKTWQERLDNQYTYPSFEVCKAMEEEIAELRKLYDTRYDYARNALTNGGMHQNATYDQFECKKHEALVKEQKAKVAEQNLKRGISPWFSLFFE